jgi:hypothetical protein
VISVVRVIARSEKFGTEIEAEWALADQGARGEGHRGQDFHRPCAGAQSRRSVGVGRQEPGFGIFLAWSHPATDRYLIDPRLVQAS